MTQRTDSEAKIAEAFIAEHFGPPSPSQPTSADEKTLARILQYVDTRFSRMKYILGLAIDFTLLAQHVSHRDKSFQPLGSVQDASAIFKKYPLVEQRGDRQANTLSLSVAGTTLGIRKFEEKVADVFHSLERSKYPSAYVYNTGQWTKYQDLLALCFGLSEAGRREAVDGLIDYGLDKLQRNAFFGRDEARVRIFERLLSEYAREDGNENGGLTSQALVFGFLRADHPHLEWIADKVRTGSARQRRFGDVDGYFGLDLELSAEVKDFAIDEANKERQLGVFIESAKKCRFVPMVFARGFSPGVRADLEGAGLVLTDDAMIKELVRRWDWVKQDLALNSMLHYLAHIEQNADAVKRLLEFIGALDEQHPSLGAG